MWPVAELSLPRGLCRVSIIFVSLFACIVSSSPRDCSLPSLPLDNVCNFDIEINEQYVYNSTIHKCRVVLGFIILRNISVSDDTNITFPDLETIRDFVHVDNIYSDNEEDVNNSLNLIFPRLGSILGHRRINNQTLSVARYEASVHLGLDSVHTICGAIKIYETHLSCFRYGPTYWNWLAKFRDPAFHFRLPSLARAHVNVNTNKEDGILAKIKFDYRIPKRWRQKYKRSSPGIAFFMFYHIDRDYYNYLKTGQQQTKCEPLKQDFLVSDVIYTHYSDRRMTETFDYKSRQNAYTLKDDPFFHELLRPPRNLTNVENESGSESYERLFDIVGLHVHSKPIDKKPFQIESPDHSFQFGEFYIIKLEFCYGLHQQDCQFSQIWLFNPQASEYNPAKASKPSLPATESSGLEMSYLLWTMLCVIVFASIVMLVMRAKSLFWFMVNMKNYRQVQVITVNPGYTNMSPGSMLNSWSMDNEIELSSSIFCEIDRDRIHVDVSAVIGKGEFGVVYVGSLSGNGKMDDAQPNTMKVAIKQLKECSSPLDKERFAKEAKLMKSLESYFIVKLFGVCTLGDPMLVVMEYMANGDLKTFLRRRHEEHRKTCNFNLLLSADQMIEMAIQIADGMYFLHSHKVIHRDLAARNMMVSDNLVIKIGDFGLTRDLFEREYYRLSESTPMPLRWMAPESVAKQVFTYASDVWSYGVVLWEIMTFGEMPYAGETDRQAKQMIMDGHKLEKPAYCLPLLWTIAHQCWRKNPSWRLTFRQVIDILYGNLGLDRETFDKHSFYASNNTTTSPPSSPSMAAAASHNLCRKFINIFSPNDRFD